MVMFEEREQTIMDKSPLSRRTWRKNPHLIFAWVYLSNISEENCTPYNPKVFYWNIAESQPVAGVA